MKQITYAFLLALTLLACGMPRAQAQAVASDGSVGVNTLWEQGTNSKWYIELQGNGLYYIQDGIAREDESLIQEGLLVYQWGADHENADGSSTSSDPFHSNCFWVVYGAEGLMALKNYHPSTYTYDPSKYAAQIAALSTKIKASAHWLAAPANLQKGMQQDAPYTHRRYLLGAALAYAALLTGDTSLSDAAVPHIQEGLGLQLTSGWRAALTQNADGTYPPAVLVKPGDPTPAAATQVWDAAGVNPEENGYDISYQCVSTLFAEDYSLTTTNTNLQTSLRAMVTASLSWEATHIATGGIPDTSGSSRTGQGHERDGTLKIPDLPEMIAACRQGAALCSDPRYGVVGSRLDGARYPVAGGAIVAADGAAGANADWEAGTAPTFAIARQAVGADWVQAGVDRNDPALIGTGLQILDWGWARQAADGSFTGTTGASWGTVQFTEAVSRAMLALKNYRPTTYRANLNLMALTIRRSAQNIHAASAWLALPANAKSLNKSVLGYASRSFTTAAAFAEAAQATGDLGLAAAGASYAANGLAMQAPNGLLQEQGGTDVNGQATGLLFAARYNMVCPDPITQSQVAGFVGNGLQWEQGYVAVNGIISGTSSPQTGTINQAFKTGYAILSSPLYATVINRIESR